MEPIESEKLLKQKITEYLSLARNSSGRIESTLIAVSGIILQNGTTIVSPLRSNTMLDGIRFSTKPR